MSQTSATETADKLIHVAADIAWRQWGSIGGSATSKQPWHSIVDPEALVLSSLFFFKVEPRIQDILFSWLERNATLLSVQRLRNLQKAYPAEAARQVADFARRARNVAKHPRWRSLGANDDEDLVTDLPDVRRAAPTRLMQPASLMLRLRAAMGVGVKADLLAVLLGMDRSATVRELVDGLSYSSVAVRDSLDDLAAAGFIRAIVNKPVAFLAPHKEWSQLLDLRRRPRWVAWHHWFAFVIDYVTWIHKSTRKDLSDYATNVKIRELVDRHDLFFRYFAHELSSPALRREMGAADSIMKAVLSWANAEARGRIHAEEES